MSLVTHRECIHSFKRTQAPPHPPTLARGPHTILLTLCAHLGCLPSSSQVRVPPPAFLLTHRLPTSTRLDGSETEIPLVSLLLRKSHSPWAVPPHLRIRRPEQVPEVSTLEPLISERRSGNLDNTSFLLAFARVMLGEVPSHWPISSGFIAQISGSCSPHETPPTVNQ